MSKNPLAGGFGNFMKQAHQMQARLQRVQSEMAEKTAEGSAGGGMVKVIANGKQEIVAVTINKEAVNPNDVEMLQDMVLEATNQAIKNISAIVSEAMNKVTGGMNIPGL